MSQPEPPPLVPTVGRLVGTMEALAAVTVLIGERAGQAAPSDVVAEHVRAVADALQVTDAIAVLDPSTAEWLHGFARSTLGQALHFVDDPAGREGWRHEDATLLQATGSLSAVFAGIIRTAVVPRLDGLADRIDSGGARFLDVGVGVAGLAIAMARACPALEVVGLDVWQPALALARTNVDASDVHGRVEIREQDVLDLDDPQSYDLVWFAGPFLPRAIVSDALTRCVDALRPGGWLLFARFGGADELTRALADLRTVRAGGHPWDDDEVLALLTDASLRDAHHLELGSGVPGRLAAARR